MISRRSRSTIRKLELGEEKPGPDLAAAAKIGLIIDAMLASADARHWVGPAFS
jgi:hypothetical protein